MAEKVEAELSRQPVSYHYSLYSLRYPFLT